MDPFFDTNINYASHPTDYGYDHHYALQSPASNARYLTPHFLTFPAEILGLILLHLTSITPIGPPTALLPLTLTCHFLHDFLLPNNNPSLYSAIFQQKYDFQAHTRRAYAPTPRQYTQQLFRYTSAMKLFRRGNIWEGIKSAMVWAGPGPGVEGDMNVEEALQLGVIMMMEDEGKNARQLLIWGRADVFVRRVLVGRMYENAWAAGNGGWPWEGSVLCWGLWLMWLLTSEESLLSETHAERVQIQSLLLPLIYAPFRYAPSLLPPHIFLPQSEIAIGSPATASIPTPHGTYPPLPPSIVLQPTITPHFSSQPTLAYPLASTAAKLLFFSRDEVFVPPVAPHFKATRAEADQAARQAAEEHGLPGAGTTRREVGTQTREDMEEVAWSWSVRLPLGSGLRTRDGRRKVVWGQAELEDANFSAGCEDEDGEQRFPARPERLIFPNSQPQPVHERWKGKAPHLDDVARARSGKAPSKSQKWDADWYRMRMCGMPERAMPRVPYGRAYVLGSIDGLWMGKMLIPSENLLQSILLSPLFSLEAFSELQLLSSYRPVFVRLREYHGVVGEVEHDASYFPPSFGSTSGAYFTAPGQYAHLTSTINNDSEFQPKAPTLHDPLASHSGLANAWFNGTYPPLVTPAPSTPGGSVERVHVEARGIGGGTRRGTYRRWRNATPQSREPRGNDAYADTISLSGIDKDLGYLDVGAYYIEREKEDRDSNDAGYEHHEDKCRACVDQKKFARALERQGTGFRSRALRSSNPPQPDVSTVSLNSVSSLQALPSQPTVPYPCDGLEEDSDDDEDEDLLEPWDDEDPGPYPHTDDGVPTHDWGRRATQRCEGVGEGEILIFGEPDPTHAHAFYPYTYYGRIRPWDGLLCIRRTPTRTQDDGTAVFYGYIVGGESVVGSWRYALGPAAFGGGGADGGGGGGLWGGGTDLGLPGWEGAFVWSKRDD